MATTAARSYCVKPRSYCVKPRSYCVKPCPQIRERRSHAPCRPLIPDPRI